MADRRDFRRSDFETDRLSPGEVFTTRGFGERGSLLRPEGGRLVLRGGPGGVGVIRETPPEVGFSPIGETIAAVGGAGPFEEEIDGPPPAVGTPEGAKVFWQRRLDEHQAKIDERDSIIREVSGMGADLDTLEDILKSKNLDKLKEPKQPEWLAKILAEGPTVGGLTSRALQKRIASETGEEVGETERRLIARELTDPLFDRALGILRGDVDFDLASSEEKMQMITDIQEQLRQGGAGAVGVGAGTGELDEATMEQLRAEVEQANPGLSDEETANRMRQIARQRGFRF